MKRGDGLLVALFNDQFVDMVGKITKEEWNTKRKTGKLVCPVCRNNVIPKCGTKKTWHFAHQSYEQCTGLHEAETNYHLLGKKGLYNWLVQLQQEPIIEFYLRDIAQRPDLFLAENNQAIEFQCAAMSPDLLRSRIMGYQSLNIQSDWIFGLKRLRQKGGSLYYIQNTDLAAAKKDHDGNLYLNYFCPLQQQFVLLRNILPLSQKKAAADSYVFSIKNVPQADWLSKTFGNESSNRHNDLWLKQKTTWRMTAFKNISPAVMYVKKVLYFNHHSLTLFPSIAGVPSKDYFLFETSPYLWQTYLLFFIEKKQTQSFRIELLINECRRLMEKRIFVVRQFPYLEESFVEALYGYLSFLEEAGYIIKVPDGTYKKVWKTHYPKTLDEALKLDKIFCEKM